MSDDVSDDGSFATNRPAYKPRGEQRDGAALRVPMSERYAADRASLGFAEALTESLNAHNVSCAELAAALGVSQGTVYRWVSGKRAPKLGQVLRIAWALGVTAASLMEAVE